MDRVRGMRAVAIDLAARTATVVFDRLITTVEAISAASTNAGHEATIKGEGNGMKASTIIKTGVAGAVIAAICCVTPVLVVLLGAVGLSAWLGWIDHVLLPALALFLGLTAYGFRRRQRAAACCTPDATTSKGAT